MIFVTVGTHEQQFNRLVRYIDEWKNTNGVSEEVVIQTGSCTYVPKYCQWSKMFPYQKMLELTEKARIVVTHGGPSSIMMALQNEKIPIVVPRQKRYEEHVNDHQLEFGRFIQKRQGNILLVEKIDTLKEQLENYDTITKEMSGDIKSHNRVFNQHLESIVDKLFS